MTGQRLFQVVGTRVACLQQQGCRLAVDEGEDAVVQVVDVAGYGPAKALLKGVERPQSGVVALCGDDGFRANDGGDGLGQVVGTANVS